MKIEFELSEQKYSVNYFFEKIKNKIKDYEFKNFNLGVSYPYDITLQEKNELKKSFQEKLIKEIEDKLNVVKSEQSFGDINITVDFNYKQIEIYFLPLFVYGIYNKLERDLPQTKDYCYKCKGRGCKFCDNKGVLRKHSVQEFIEIGFREKINFKELKFHGAGREDIDVLMLGNGREFVVELTQPKQREIQQKLKSLEKSVNKCKKIKIFNLKISNKKEVVKIKQEQNYKEYFVKIKCEEKINEKDINKIKINEVINIKQKTPKRVDRRRAILVRERKAEILKKEITSPYEFNLNIKAQAGLYIKEFISGENDNTKPSVTNLLEKKCWCKELDVVWIYRDE